MQFHLEILCVAIDIHKGGAFGNIGLLVIGFVIIGYLHAYELSGIHHCLLLSKKNIVLATLRRTTLHFTSWRPLLNDNNKRE